MIPKVLIAIFVCVFFGRNCILADFSFLDTADIHNSPAHALRRFKRSLTTICVEIRPRSPQEEPYFMCNGGALPTFANNANAPTLYDGSSKPSNTAISPPHSFAGSNPHIAVYGKENDFQAPPQNLYSTNANGNTQRLFYQHQQPFSNPNSYSSTSVVQSSPNQDETVQQYEKFNGYEPIKDKESPTLFDFASKTYIFPSTSNTYSNTAAYAHQHNNNYQPESVNTNRESYSQSSVDPVVPSANAKKTFAHKQISNAYEAAAPEIPPRSAARPSTPTTTSYTAYVVPEVERSTAAYIKPTAMPFESSTEYQGNGAGHSSARQFHSTTPQPQSESQPQLQRRAVTNQRQPISPVINYQHQPPTTRLGTDRYRTVIDREVFDLPNLGFSMDEFDIMAQGREYISPIQLQFPADVHLIPQERMIPTEHMDDPIMRTFYASLLNQQSPTDVHYNYAPKAYVTPSHTSPIPDYQTTYGKLSTSPLSPPPVINTIPCSPASASTYTTPPDTPIHPSPFYSALQSNPPYRHVPASDYDSKCRSCKPPEYSFQPIIIALPWYGQQFCGDGSNSYKPEILGLANPVKNQYASAQPNSILGSPSLFPGTQFTARSPNPTTFSGLGLPRLNFWPQQQTSSHFFAGPQTSSDLLGTLNPMTANLFAEAQQQPFHRIFPAPQQILSTQNLANNGQNTQEDSIVGSSYAYTQINTTPKTTTPIPQFEGAKTKTTFTTEAPNKNNSSELVEEKDVVAAKPADESALSEEEATQSSVEPVVASTPSIGEEILSASLEDESKKTFSALLHLAQNAAKIHQSDIASDDKGVPLPPSKGAGIRTPTTTAATYKRHTPIRYGK